MIHEEKRTFYVGLLVPFSSDHSSNKINLLNICSVSIMQLTPLQYKYFVFIDKTSNLPIINNSISLITNCSC